jgi:hypothetical protein
MVSTPPLVRDLRADLARRPTMTELFHRGYNPRTLPPEFTTWFDFVSLTLVMHQHDRPDVAGCEAVVREIARQHDFVECIDHERVTSEHRAIFVPHQSTPRRISPR